MTESFCWIDKREKVFGVSLEEVMQNTQEKTRLTPKIISECARFVVNNGLSVNDIFFKTPDPEKLLHIRKSLDRCEDVVLENDEKHVHIAAQILLNWVRELPQPLIPSSFYDLALSSTSNPFSHHLF